MTPKIPLQFRLLSAAAMAGSKMGPLNDDEGHAYISNRDFVEACAVCGGHRSNAVHALAAAAREGGDAEQAPGEAPQSGGKAVTPKEGS